MIIQLIIDSVVSGGMAIGTFSLAKRLSNKKVSPDKYGAYPWLLEYRAPRGYEPYAGFHCPKCSARRCNQTQGAICDDVEHYFNPHFHFECKDCGFKCVMRTIDDK